MFAYAASGVSTDTPLFMSGQKKNHLSVALGYNSRKLGVIFNIRI